MACDKQDNMLVGRNGTYSTSRSFSQPNHPRDKLITAVIYMLCAQMCSLQVQKYNPNKCCVWLLQWLTMCTLNCWQLHYLFP